MNNEQCAIHGKSLFDIFNRLANYRVNGLMTIRLCEKCARDLRDKYDMQKIETLEDKLLKGKGASTPTAIEE